MNTKKIEIGTINIDCIEGRLAFNLLEMIVIHEALKEYQAALLKTPEEGIVADCGEILSRLLETFGTVDMNRYISLGCVSIEDIKSWSAHGFGSEVIELRHDTLPF